ncbi:MAG: hypothetical protein KC620_01060 [Myxococcales bacterium]|nr:hypothetical protein [Myxococcales bacterium]
MSRRKSGLDPDGPLARALSLERQGHWPTDLPPYREAIEQLARDLLSPLRSRARQAELSVFLKHVIGAIFIRPEPVEARARLDAFEEMIADRRGLAETLRTMAARLTPENRPNLVSFLKAKVLWRGKDIHVSEVRRHERRTEVSDKPYQLQAPELRTLPGPRVMDAKVLVQQVLDHFGDDRIFGIVLDGLLNDESIADISRRVGCSRQQVYRYLDQIKAWINGERSS